MPYCSILECKNDSRRKNLTNGNVSYHRFPKDANIKEKWIDATGRVNWMPTKSSTICSDHFLEEYFLISNKGYRYIKPTIVPTLKIVKSYSEPQNIQEATCSKRQGDSENSNITQPKKESRFSEGFMDTQNITVQIDDMIVQPHSMKTNQMGLEKVKSVNTTSSNCSTPRKEKLKGQLRFCQDKLKKQGLKIKRLQLQNRRLKNKLNILYELLKKLK